MINSDWEGPWVTADHARSMVEYAIPKIGGKVFDRISEYDDYRFYVLKGNSYGNRKYEPGDTLSLIAPILISFGITERDLIKVAKESSNFIKGAKSSIEFLKKNYDFNVITTSYKQYIDYTSKLVGISKDNIYGTFFPIDRYGKEVDEKDKKLVKSWVTTISKLQKLNLNIESKRDDLNSDQLKMIEQLDHFFFELLPETSFARILEEVKPIGGSRKYEAIIRFLKNKRLSESVTMGDSITDVVMLDKTKKAEGLALCFNGNKYAMNHSNLSIVSDDCTTTAVIADIFEKSSLDNLMKIVNKWNIKTLKDTIKQKVLSKEIFEVFRNSFPSKLMKFPIVYKLEDDKDIEKKIKVSEHFRKIVRGKEIGSLG